MTAEEVFEELLDKYGEEFDWCMIPLTNKYFVEELKREIGTEDELYNKKIWAVAKCDSNDNVLFLIDSQNDEDIYRIYHLSYAKQNIEGFPKFIEIIGIEAVKEHIERQFVERYSSNDSSSTDINQ